MNDAGNPTPGTLASPALEPIGIPVIWALDNGGANGKWVVFNDNDADIAAAIAVQGTVNASTLPDESPIGVVVGGALGLGFNNSDVTVDADGETVTVFFRGANNAGVIRNGIDYTAGGVTTSAANQLAFEKQLQRQGIVVVDLAEVITPSFTS